MECRRVVSKADNVLIFTSFLLSFRVDLAIGSEAHLLHNLTRNGDHMKKEAKKIGQKYFGTQTVFDKTNSFYRIFILNCFFALCSLPWVAVNGILKFTPQTYPLFALTGIGLFAGIRAVYELLPSVRKEEHLVSFKEFRKVLWQGTSRSIKLGLITAVGVAVLLLEIMIILKNAQMNLLLPLFFFAVVFFSVTMMMMLYVDTKWHYSLKHSIKMAALLVCRNPFRALMYFVILTLWLSIGYYAPLVNLIIGNLLFLYGSQRLMERYVLRFTEKSLQKFGETL